VQTVLLVISIGGSFIPLIRNNPLYQKYQDKKMFIILGAYFGLNMLQNMLSSTGAFEIFLNDQLIFSKLQTNRIPTLKELEAFF
jgi:selT/selW/selH-like putative selenoprotein